MCSCLAGMRQWRLVQGCPKSPLSAPLLWRSPGGGGVWWEGTGDGGSPISPATPRSMLGDVVGASQRAVWDETPPELCRTLLLPRGHRGSPRNPTRQPVPQGCSWLGIVENVDSFRRMTTLQALKHSIPPKSPVWIIITCGYSSYSCK